MSSPAGPTADEVRQTFAALLNRAVLHGHPAPAEAGLDPAVLAAINAVAQAWPRAPAALISKARTTFALCERTRISATKSTTPLNIHRPRP